jgi:energy-coupling factor transport system permease protein
VSTYFLPRTLHGGAWWGWALGIAIAASRTTNPLVLALLVASVVCVVLARRPEAPWALAFRLYVVLACVVIVLRLAFRVLLNGTGPTVLVHLPALSVGSFTLLGPLSAEALVSGFYDGARLAVMVIAVGAANCLANPKRLLKSTPGAVYEFGTVVVVALSQFPQLAESVRRVARARALRGGEKGRWHVLRQVVAPVLADSLDRSLALAAAMDSRGYGRAAHVPRRARNWTAALMLAAAVAICIGLYGAADSSTNLRSPALVLSASGVAVAAVALKLAGRRSRRTRYRPDHLGVAELVVLCGGALCALGLAVVAARDPSVAYTSVYPLAWPWLSPLALIASLAPAIAGLMTPPPPRPNEMAEAAS